MKLEDMPNEELLSELYQSYYAACCTRSAKIEEAIIKTKDFMLKESRYLFASDGFYKLMEKNVKGFE